MKAMRGLESPTPSGSEFVGDVTRCVEHVKRRERSLHDGMIMWARRAQASETQVAELAEALRGMQRAADEVAAEFICYQRATNWGIVNDAYCVAECLLVETGECSKNEEGRTGCQKL